MRFIVGSRMSHLRYAILSAPWFPLTRYIAKGSYALYDIQCFSGTRHFNVIFDVGANVGQTAHGLISYFPVSQIYCFEPATAPFEKLKSNYGHKVHCFQKALGSARESRTLFIQGDSELNTFVQDAPRNDPSVRPETVEVDTIDRFCEELNIGAIDLLKIDAQGWELEVLRGANRMIDANSVRFIYAEVGFRRVDSDIAYFPDLHATLEQKGYLFAGLYDNFRWGDKKVVHFANALYFNPKFSTEPSKAQVT
jgi:FkbM family methyltransferase